MALDSGIIFEFVGVANSVMPSDKNHWAQHF
jgi:hypothetical protein